MNDLIRHTIILVALSLLAGISISIVNKQTENRRISQTRRIQMSLVESVFPRLTEIEKIVPTAPNRRPYWIGKKNNALVGYACMGSHRGYRTPINFIVSFLPDGTILNLKIVTHTETLAIGARINENSSPGYLWASFLGRRSSESLWFCEQFSGLSGIKPIQIKKQREWRTLTQTQKSTLRNENSITALTSATISTRGVVQGVHETITEFLSTNIPATNENKATKDTMQCSLKMN
ncbi:MAG: FMN-binding protein [Chitinivibrionales bacterium]|nr:FMN-binding protein [Chitinivibrionales bacterium]